MRQKKKKPTYLDYKQQVDIFQKMKKINKKPVADRKGWRKDVKEIESIGHKDQKYL